MFEHREQAVLSKSAFSLRLATHGAIFLGIVGGALSIGILGYHELEGMPWIDSLVNAAMLLGGMGPVGELHTDAGKLFAACYALFSGLIFIVAVGVLFAPAAHRFLHRFHMASDSEDSTGQP